jgi:hypothetical protein
MWKMFFTYLLEPTITIPLVQKTSTEFLPNLGQGEIATKREPQNWHQ